MITAKNITKIFNGKTQVLNNVDLTINDGDFVSIIGESGSGKSTLLTILGGIDKPSSGEVLIDGENISQKNEKELAILRRTKVGFVFQFFNLAPYLTVKENIMLPIILDGKKPKDYELKAKELINYLSLTGQENKLPSTLSGGEQQRVAIARGLIFNPEVIFLDEPTGNLDSKNSREIMELLKNINIEKGTTIVQVTHSIENASYGNRIITIKDGKIIEEKNVAENIISESKIIKTEDDNK